MFNHLIFIGRRPAAALLAGLAMIFVFPAIHAEAQADQAIDSLRKDISYLSSGVCGVTAPTDAAQKKLYDEQKQLLADKATALIAALDQQKAKLTGSDFDTTLTKQRIDDEETSLKQACPSLPANLQKLVSASSAGTATAVSANNASDSGNSQQVTVSPTGALDFDAQIIGTSSDPKQVTLTNHTSNDTNGLAVYYEDLPNFQVTDNTCSNVPIPDKGTCSFKVAFAPKAMEQQQGNIWIVPSKSWRDHQKLWAKYDELSPGLDVVNTIITAARNAKNKKNTKDSTKKTSNEERQLNLTFCADESNLSSLSKEVKQACGTLATAENAWKAVQDDKATLREQALAIIPLTGSPNHWKYPLVRSVVGLDLSAVSSQTVRQAYFVDFNLLAPFKFPGASANADALESRWWFWLNPRITSLPKAADPSALSTIDEAGTFFTNFSNKGTTADIAQGFDVNGGVEMALLKPRNGIPWWSEYVNTQARLGISLIGGAGIATPFSITDADVTSQVNQSICDAFKAPTGATMSGPSGLVCTFPSGSNTPQVVVGPNPAFDPKNPMGSATLNDPNITFFTPERSRFFRRYYGGIRLKTYFFSPDVGGECDPKIKSPCKAPYDIFPGIIDITAGQDEAVTAGKLSRVLFRVEGVYPLPFVPGFHVFGSIYTSFKRNTQEPPFNTFTINTPTDGTANDANTFRFPLNPLDRDYFRIGVGVDLIQLLKRNKGGQPTTTTSPSSSQSSSSTPSQSGGSGSSTTP